MSWPRTEAQQPINVGDPDYDPLFPFGFSFPDSPRDKEETARDPLAAAAAEATDLLVRADRVLAQGAIDTAIAGGGDLQDIDHAQREMARAESYLGAGRPDRAVQRFGKAWEHAVDALDE